MLEEVEEGFPSPLDVLEDADERCRFFEQLAEGPGNLLRRGGGVALAEQWADRGGCSGLGWQRVELLDHLDHGPVGDAFARGKTAALDDSGLDRCERLRDKARLAHTRLSDDSDEHAARFCQRLLPGLVDDGTFLLPAD